ncbi:MAG TPA: hypothetical protein VG755_13930, partial [Nannocystaceae bacterium]|nr:hypothetical protein [Nannocystaceae bacterium]
VQLAGMSSAELRRVVLARHHLSGYELHFDPPTPRASERLRRPLATTRARRDPETAYFARLAALTDGNPRQALYFWQRTAMLDAARDRVLVAALPDRPAPLSAKLPVGQRLILALLAQHGSLAVDEVAAAIGVAPDSALSELRFLQASGWIARGAGVREHWTLAPVAAHPITLELRSGNMV